LRLFEFFHFLLGCGSPRPAYGGRRCGRRKDETAQRQFKDCLPPWPEVQRCEEEKGKKSANFFKFS